MTRPHHEWGSVEIAEHVRRDDMPRYADLREGCMYCGDDEPLIRAPWLLIWAIAFTVAGLGLALLAGEPPSAPSEPFINCYSEGC